MPEPAIDPPSDSHQGLVDDIAYCADEPPFPERARYGCVNCGSTNHTTGDTNWCPTERERADEPPFDSQSVVCTRCGTTYQTPRWLWCPKCGNEPPSDYANAASHFYWARPVTLCTDNRADDDDGPPNWGVRPPDGPQLPDWGGES